MPARRPTAALALLLLCPAVAPAADAEPAAFIDASQELRLVFGDRLDAVPTESVSAELVRLAESLPAGGAIDLPTDVPAGVLDFRGIADGIQVTGGRDGRLILGSQRGVELLFLGLDQHIAGPAVGAAGGGVIAAGEDRQVLLFEQAKPASDLLAMFCRGKIAIDHPVENCAWIAGDNAFGRKVVTANAPVNDSLFLCFGINWGFQDYNAHWKPENAGRTDWMDNAQMHIDAKGEGEGTRFYLMVETNYGNPGPGVVLENCKDMALMHGSTERSSSQGPGNYHLKNCEGVLLGQRGINVYFPPLVNKMMPAPARDVTVEGGKGNMLYGVKAWGATWEHSLVNSDPALQLWMTALEFDAVGVDRPGVLRYAFTPNLMAPRPDFLKANEAKIEKNTDDLVALMKKHWGADPDPAEIEKVVRRGVTLDEPYNASEEVTFTYGGVDLTKPGATLPKGMALPAPPSVPATDAPRTDRPIAFTQADGFGQPLLKAGADPTGKKPSDDAFAQVLFGMDRDAVQQHLDTIEKAWAQYEAGKLSEADAWAKANAALGKLRPQEEWRPGKFRPVMQDRLEIPAGRFRLEHTLPIFTVKEVFGAGPDKTTLFTENDIAVVKQMHQGSINNLAVEGGRVGLEITGADHHAKVPATLQSYVSGKNFFRLHFRDQSFAGVHLGYEDPEVMGGAEFDQNRFVQMKFENTGDYGIYMNQNMLDKWLLLHCDFAGQKKGGLTIRFNNLIHAAIIGCTFEDIDGPGLDLLSGNPEIVYRPWCILIDQCTFTECGSEDRPAVDLGFGELMSLMRTEITTKGKTIKAGYMGSAQIVEALNVDVKTAGGEPAVWLRAVRNGNVAMANGHVLRGVTANGPVGFVNDANDFNAYYTKTLEKLGRPDAELNWDANPAVHENPPANGWVHPFVFYDCAFGEASHGYELLNVDTDAGKVVERIDLAPLAGAASE